MAENGITLQPASKSHVRRICVDTLSHLQCPYMYIGTDKPIASWREIGFPLPSHLPQSCLLALPSLRKACWNGTRKLEMGGHGAHVLKSAPSRSPREYGASRSRMSTMTLSGTTQAGLVRWEYTSPPTTTTARHFHLGV